MSINRQRRIRGAGKATVALNVHVDPITKTKIDRIADALGRSQGQTLDLIVDHADLKDALSAAKSDVTAFPAHGRQRRTRGEGKLTVALNVHIDPDAKDRIEAAADTLGRSQGQTLDLMLSRTEVDAHGRPDFWAGPLATDYQRELPMASSA